ncbi:MAG: Crp/Fnr family transcriptional regulator [Roseivirga sp.]|nr:Crp/Fnr family transcriptional regulator [Roseivirga sp.]
MHPLLLSQVEQYIVPSQEDIDTLHSKLGTRRYLKGQYLVQQGDICPHLSFITSGCSKTFHIDPQGNEHITRFAIEGWWSADLGSFLTQTAADCSVKCLEDTHVLQITHQGMQELYKEAPAFERFFRNLFENSFIHSEKRVIANFSLTAKERYLAFQKRYPQIEQRVPQYMVASYLGMTKQFLSKIRNQLMVENS